MGSYFARRFAAGEMWVVKLRTATGWRQYNTRIRVQRNEQGEIQPASTNKVRTAVKRLQDALNRGDDIFRKKTEVGFGLKFVCEEYIRSRIDQWSLGTAINRRDSVKQILAYFGDVEISRVSSAQVDSFRKKLGRDLSPATVNSRLTDLFAILRFAREVLHVASVPKIERRFLEVPESQDDYLTRDELALVLEQCKRVYLNGESIYDIVCWCANTGMRRGEVLKCRREWIRNDVVFLPGALTEGGRTVRVTKNGKGRRIPVWGELHEILSRCPSKGLLFPRMTIEVSRRFKTAVKLAGIERDLHFHNLRDTFAVQQLDRGVPLRVVQQIVGDGLKVMEKHYLAVNTTELLQAMQR